MVEDYGIKIRTHAAELTGEYEITRQGTRKAKKKLVERYVTPAGTFLPKEWKKRAMEEIEAAGEMELLENIKEHCLTNCAWLRKEEIEEYAIGCLCHRSYRAWKDFESKETIIWM